MADEYIRRDFALAGTELYKYGEMEIEAVSAEHIQRLPAADVAEVVRGKPVQTLPGMRRYALFPLVQLLREMRREDGWRLYGCLKEICRAQMLAKKRIR